VFWDCVDKKKQKIWEKFKNFLVELVSLGKSGDFGFRMGEFAPLERKYCL
jgi:hypothetical protein